MALLRWLTWRFRARTILAVTILILGVVLPPKLLAGVPKLVLVLAGIIGLLLMGAIVAPRLLLSRELVAGLKPADRLNAENQLRGTMMQGLTGLLVLSGAFVAWQQVQVGQRQLESTTADQRTTQQISRERQITDRYTRAIEQLGSKSLELRLGAIYSLERIAKDSEADRGTDLRGADLTHADLTDADLEQADLRGALLEDAILNRAKLTEAVADSTTVWPAGFDVEAANVRVHH